MQNSALDSERLPRLPGQCGRRLVVGPADQLLQMVFGKRIDPDDGDPVKPVHIPGRLDAALVRQPDIEIRLNTNTEAPLLRIACLEIGKLPVTDFIREDIGRIPLQLLPGAGEGTAISFDLVYVHCDNQFPF